MKGAAFSSGPSTYLDHLCPLTAELGLPMIVWDNNNFQACKIYYPQTAVIEITPCEATPSFFSEHFDLILHTNQFWRITTSEQALLEKKKPLKTVFCPHGNSDKKYSVSLSDYPISQEYALIYGDHMKDHLMKKGAFAKIAHPIITGNFRLAFYQKHRAFYQKLLHTRLTKLDPKKKTIFYAPTWPDGENACSFFEESLQLAQSLHPHFNIIIKQHPFLEASQPAKAYYLKAQYEKLPSTVALDDFPVIYPILDFSDIYIGDFSSVGYDFLAFDKPMYFFNPEQLDPATCRGALLHTCGITIQGSDKQDYPHFFHTTLDTNYHTYQGKRQALYQHAFAPTLAPDKLWQSLQ